MYYQQLYIIEEAVEMGEKARISIGMQLAGMFAVVTILLLSVLGFSLYHFQQAAGETEVIVN